MESQLLDLRELRLARNGAGAPGRIGVVYIDKVSGEHYRWNPVAGVMQPAAFASPLAARTSSEVYARAASRLNPIALALRSFGTGPVTPFPTASPVRQITGTTRYVNPSLAVNGNGLGPDLAASPGALGAFNSAAGAISALAASQAGDGVLFAAGTTLPPAGATLTPAVGGVVIGVYNPATGARVMNRTGAATINCGSAAFDTISAVNKNNVCVDGLRFINPPPANWCVNISGTSAGGQILRCAASGGAFHFAVQSSGTGHNLEFNDSTNASDFGILYLLGADDTTSTLNFNRATGGGIRGLMVWDNGTGRRFSGRIQANHLTDGGVANGSAGLLQVWCRGGAPKITHNYGTRGRHGIWVESTGTGPADWTGYINENNDFTFCEFNLLHSRMQGDFLVQYNSYPDAGTNDGVNPVTSDAYGRCIEFYGLTFADRVQGGTVRWNYVGRAKAHPRATGNFPGSEGVGIGLDNNTYDVKVYGNYSDRNEGAGLQANSGGGNSFYGNWSVDDACADAANVANWPDETRAPVQHSLSPDTYIGNNTIICTGKPAQRHGVAENKLFPSPDTITANNVIVGTIGSAISRNPTVNSAERGNLAINCASLVTSSVTEMSISADATTAAGSMNDLDASSPFYPPTAGGAADATGVASIPGAVSGSGALLTINPPRGALHAALT
jgi:hypothetical protein